MTMGALTGLLVCLKRKKGSTMMKIEVLAAKSQKFENCADPIEVRKLQLGTSA
jgi:hypothetical protein